MARMNRWRPLYDWSHDIWVLDMPDGSSCEARRADDVQWVAYARNGRGKSMVELKRSRYAAQRACRRMLRELTAG